MALTRESLLDYLRESLGLDADGVEDATPLFSSSLVDSFGMVGLIAFIEKAAGIRIDAWDVTLENLDSIGRILSYVEARTASA